MGKNTLKKRTVNLIKGIEKFFVDNLAEIAITYTFLFILMR